ncbi:MAG: histidine kinase [Bacteroidetes bacterium]|nr:histidine kinase [Bacteroidota bacterium]
MMAGLRGGLTIGGFAAAIKLMKCFYERQQAALTFEKEKVNAELQMLKAQLHPHFLFNTLNNIYSLTQETSAKASSMIMGLSAILRYILYDCNKPSVPLKKELDMIREYLHLEALRYDQSLDLSITLPTDTKASIAPLLLLPFVENAFKHGASTMIDRPWISLNVELTGNTLSLQLVNGKSPRTATSATIPDAPSSGIGIANVRKRLELLYPQRHILQINEEEEIFYVNLKIDLYTEFHTETALEQQSEPPYKQQSHTPHEQKPEPPHQQHPDTPHKQQPLPLPEQQPEVAHEQQVVYLSYRR